MIQSENFIAIPPGVTIREQLENRSMNQKEFAQRMNMSEKHISNLINGKVELTHDVALRLESVLGISAQFWINREALYREQEARVREELDFENDRDIAKKMPYSECATLGWVPKTRNINEKVHSLRKFFEVARLEVLSSLQLPGIAYRVVGTNDSNDYVQAMWTQKARVEARAEQVEAINIKLLKELIPEIRALTREPASVFCEKLRIFLSRCGIVLVFLPHIKGSFLHGAIFPEGRYFVLGLTVRGRDADKFWFTLFHELGHVIQGHSTHHLDFNSTEYKKAEDEADAFARNTLIPEEQYEAFIVKSDFSKLAIVDFSNRLGIAPGIVLGRVQKDNYLPYSYYHELKEKYIIA